MIGVSREVPRITDPIKTTIRQFVTADVMGGAYRFTVPSRAKCTPISSGIHGSEPNAKAMFAKQSRVKKVRISKRNIFKFD